jgi:hypothetical protein
MNLFIVVVLECMNLHYILLSISIVVFNLKRLIILRTKKTIFKKFGAKKLAFYLLNPLVLKQQLGVDFVPAPKNVISPAPKNVSCSCVKHHIILGAPAAQR